MECWSNGYQYSVLCWQIGGVIKEETNINWIKEEVSTRGIYDRES